jgi:hypothetical protein
MFIIQQVQIYSNNGSTLLYQHVNEVEQYLINCVTTSRNEHENSAAYHLTSAAYMLLAHLASQMGHQDTYFVT